MDCPQDDLQVISSQGEVLPQPNEFQKLLQSLPIRKSLINKLLYLYDGFWIDEQCLEAMLAFQQNFQAQDTDIILASTPKSGTTWLKSLVFTVTRRFRYTISDKNHPLVTTNPHGLVPFFECGYPQNPAAAGTPRLFATHLPYTMMPESIKTCKCKIIYLCRNPRDSFVSMSHFEHKIRSKHDPFSLMQFPSLEERFDQFCGVFTIWSILGANLAVWKLSNEGPEKVLFLKYEELKADIIGQCKKMADFMNCSFLSEEENQGVIKDIAKFCSFEHLSILEVNKQTEERSVPWTDNGWYFRKGEIGDWKNLITTSMAEKLDLLVEQKLHGSGLKLN